MSKLETKETNQYCLVLTTTNDQQLAKSIAKNLIIEQDAACVQLDEVESFFSEQGIISEAKEFRLMIKILAKNYKQLELKIKKMHNYAIPQIVKLNIDDGLAAYLQWVQKASTVN